MINDRIFVAIIVILIFVLGIQFYMIFQMNQRINQLPGQGNQIVSPQIKLPKLPDLTVPSQVPNDELFGD